MADRRQVARLLRNVFTQEERFLCGLVVERNERGDEILSETSGLSPNYIRQLLSGAPRTQTETQPRTLLYLLLRHAWLLEHARAGVQVLQERKLISRREQYEKEMVGITSDEPTLFAWLDQPVAGLTGTETLSEYLVRPRARPVTRAEHIFDEYRNALLTLEPLPTAELERLFTETLDVCAYRLDAWATSLASKRLETMREARPLGAYVGAYGWVEDLKPFPADERHDVSIEGEEGVKAHTYSGGYIYAPSMTHGAAAAVLRNGYMTRSGEEQSPYAINLSSARVRTALWLLDTVREGQLLGASLGYLFERGLHDAGLDRYVEPFREKYRMVSSQTDVSGEPADALATRDVVDGYALLQDFRHSPPRHWTDMTASQPDGRPGVDAVLASVDAALDALADLLTAESVFQMVGGSSEGAGATLDTMSKGAHPPEPEIANRVRGGTSVTHRVVLPLAGEPGGEIPWPAEPRTPRAEIEPLLNAWAGRLLGNPSNVVCSVGFSNGERVRVTLENLRLQPLDVLALAKAGAPIATTDSELDRRVASAATLLAAAGSTQPVIQYDVPELGPSELAFPEILEVARAINALLSATRPLHPRDLLVPEEAADVEADGADLRQAELEARSAAALAHLVGAIRGLDDALPADGVAAGAIDVVALRAALRAASLLGVAAAFPPMLDADLVSIAQSVQQELQRRLERASTPQVNPIERVHEIFGRDFVFLPRFSPAHRAELMQALVNTPDLGADPDDTLAEWLAKASRVRPQLGAWRMLSLYAGSMGRVAALPKVLQLPYSPDARWIGLPLDAPPAPRPRAGQVSLMLVGDRIPADAAVWSGLLLDEWVELIPNAKEDAAVVFHYDRPGAQAPHAVLVAVPPDSAEQWSLDLLIRTVGQTFEMAKARGFDGEWKRASDGGTSHALYDNPWLPLILMAEGDQDATIATSFRSCIARGSSG